VQCAPNAHLKRLLHRRADLLQQRRLLAPVAVQPLLELLDAIGGCHWGRRWLGRRRPGGDGD